MKSTKVVYLTAGAGGMFCGSCMHDNALASALMQLGLDVMLVPTYTPIRTDEEDVSVDRVFFGGINVYLQQKFPPFRWLPSIFDRFLDNPGLIRRITSRAIDVPSDDLGKLALSMLRGLQGNQRKEVRRLAHWLAREARPEIVVFTNALIGGCISEIKKLMQIPVLVTLQGDDMFLDSLPDPYREECIAAVRSLVANVDGFIVHTEFYRDYMSRYFAIPIEKFYITPLGIQVDDLARLGGVRRGGNAVGYLARLAPEKGLHNLVTAFLELKATDCIPDLKLRIAGWLGSQNADYAREQFGRIRAAGFENDFEYLGALERNRKLEFLQSIDVLSVPTEFLEPKGLYVLEALAAGVPVVQPNHGCFPELIDKTGGGLLYRAGENADYIAKLREIFEDRKLYQRLASTGQASVERTANAATMAAATAAVIEQFVR